MLHGLVGAGPGVGPVTCFGSVRAVRAVRAIRAIRAIGLLGPLTTVRALGAIAVVGARRAVGPRRFTAVVGLIGTAPGAFHRVLPVAHRGGDLLEGTGDSLWSHSRTRR